MEVLNSGMPMLVVEIDDEGNIIRSRVAEDEKKNEGKCSGMVKGWVPAIVDGGMECWNRLIGMEAGGEIKV